MVRVIRFWNNQRRLSIVMIAGAVLVLSWLDHAGAFGYRGQDAARYDGATGRVVHAADGETIDVDLPDGSREVTRIRLWGVDCPEIGHGPGAGEAYEYVRREIVGKPVRIALDPNRRARDTDGQLLAYVFVENTNEMLQEQLISRGLAYADGRFQHVMKHRFIELEKRAMKEKRGLWAGVTPGQMPAWRQRMDEAGAR